MRRFASAGGPCKHKGCSRRRRDTGKAIAPQQHRHRLLRIAGHLRDRLFAHPAPFRADGLMVEVSTPPLAGDGWRLRLAGVTQGGGDHFLQLRVRTEEGLRIDGLRVLYPLELAPADAVLGCQVVVPTLEGPVRLRVPAGSSSGRLLRLRGRGLRDGQRCGDQLVEVRIVVPTDLDEAEQALYRRLQQLAQEREEGGSGADR